VADHRREPDQHLRGARLWRDDEQRERDRDQLHERRLDARREVRQHRVVEAQEQRRQVDDARAARRELRLSTTSAHVAAKLSNPTTRTISHQLACVARNGTSSTAHSGLEALDVLARVEHQPRPRNSRLST